MQKLIAKVAQTLVMGAAIFVAIAVDLPQAMASALIQEDLFFGRNLPDGTQVSDEQFQTFVDKFITPHFPAGLTIFDANNQFESNKVVTLFVEDNLKTKKAIAEIIAAYRQQFHQKSVLQINNQDYLKVGFGAGENLIDNDPNPEFIQTDLFFGRNIAGGTQVTQEQFQAFVDRFITPRFPDGLTIFDANGQFEDSTGTIIQEPSKVVRLLLEDTQENETALDEIIKAYIEQFRQESVLAVVDEDVEVIVDSKSPTSVPEPQSAIGLFAIGVLGASIRQKKLFGFKGR
ncbi:DUF3574 domain-containing protein [Candidatus Gracilibacteria bacterium]|nr:DUF3574 domain-containing protein [Candidatus Gracilibacteria bacterium]